VLLLDEPTASLDSAQRVLLWERVAGLRAGGGAVCFATQSPEEVVRAHRTIELREGRLVGS
jgi:ABC-type multidrug transport system ATPase subunit